MHARHVDAGHEDIRVARQRLRGEQAAIGKPPDADALRIDMGAAIDRSLISSQDMRVDVEMNGAHTRGETVASRHNSSDRKVLRDDRYVIEGIEKVQPNVRVAVESDAQRFIQLFISRMAGK